MKRIYIAGPITGVENYRAAFYAAEVLFHNQGHAVMNPARLPAYDAFTHEHYMRISLAMLRACDTVYMLPNWKASRGACIEHGRASEWGMEIMYHEHGDDA